MEPVLRAWIEKEPGLSLVELCQRLVEQGVSIKIGALWHQLNKWGLTFKKNAARQRARTRGRAAGAKGVAASATHDGSRKARVYR
jgi:transposase